MIELTKSQKKIARELITLGLQRECQSFKNEIEQFTGSSEWKTGIPQELYHKLYDIVTTFDKHIARRYNGLSGSHYFDTVLALFYNEILMPEDIARFEIEVQNKLVSIKDSWITNG
jgi:hypothetical protein